jgi:hypothetical protein
VANNVVSKDLLIVVPGPLVLRAVTGSVFSWQWALVKKREFFYIHFVKYLPYQSIQPCYAWVVMSRKQSAEKIAAVSFPEMVYHSNW